VIKISNGKAQWVDIKNGREAEGRVEVYGPLNIGDTLVTVANEERRNGSEVKQIHIADK
jgi:hypothetical protein